MIKLLAKLFSSLACPSTDNQILLLPNSLFYLYILLWYMCLVGLCLQSIGRVSLLEWGMIPLPHKSLTVSSSPERGGILWSPLPSIVEFWWPKSSTGLGQVATAAVSSLIQQVCFVQKRTFYSILSHPPTLTSFFQTAFPQSFLSLGKVV